MDESNRPIQQVVIVGGGTAGWLTACILGAEFESGEQGLAITLVESPDTPTIGVGEGTWPSMRSTLKKIGISETSFMRHCGASLKQGTYFRQWREDAAGDSYYHPFTPPLGYAETNLAEHWLAGLCRDKPFAQAVTPQGALCDRAAAPKQIGIPEYGYVLNYGYHLDAGRFADLLQQTATQQFEVTHLQEHVEQVEIRSSGDIDALVTRTGKRIAGDLFVDCSGFESLLLSGHYQVPLVPVDRYLFNNRALAVQVPYEATAEAIRSTTWSTAQDSGWIWDIGLRDRRGVGYVHAADYCSDAQAHDALDRYLKETGVTKGLDALAPRMINFQSGYRQQLWHRNCVAIGLSGGFVEPLEASALVLIELSARALADNLPTDRSLMDLTAKNFNEEFTGRWEQIIDFLKLHYVLSARDDSPYWRDNRHESSIPESLKEKLRLWQSRTPWHQDERRSDELFPSASYQYVLYGMGFQTRVNQARRGFSQAQQRAQQFMQEVDQQVTKFSAHLPSNRDLLQQVHERSFPGAQG
jgi:2-polyprenyl-6-methoxyphenol hydroxylase-like FAD-dependent oxidoreductase